jgi:hypothetical protein
MLDAYFVSSSTLHRNERVKLAALFWNIVGAGMFIGGVAGAFFYEGPLFWGKVGIAVVGIVLALIFHRVGDRILSYCARRNGSAADQRWLVSIFVKRAACCVFVPLRCGYATATHFYASAIYVEESS